jgi:hypothetical protein
MIYVHLDVKNVMSDLTVHNLTVQNDAFVESFARLGSCDVRGLLKTDALLQALNIYCDGFSRLGPLAIQGQASVLHGLDVGGASTLRERFVVEKGGVRVLSGGLSQAGPESGVEQQQAALGLTLFQRPVVTFPGQAIAEVSYSQSHGLFLATAAHNPTGLLLGFPSFPASRPVFGTVFTFVNKDSQSMQVDIGATGFMATFRDVNGTLYENVSVIATTMKQATIELVFTEDSTHTTGMWVATGPTQGWVTN